MMSPSQTVTVVAPERRALILVVERNPIVQRLERYFLEQAGYAVEFVADGVLALARARELHPQILVTEILVPKMDGLSLCHTLKSDPRTSNIRVLVFSHLHAEERAREAGADAFLIKPLDETLLIENVERLISTVSSSAEAEK
jgi:two-component system response regulator MprA